MLAFAHTALIYTVPFLAVLTLVITVHEFGHFIVARLCGVAVDRFSIGFGRAILSWKARDGMEWRIGWLPLGGYVRFSGDESVASIPDAEDLAGLKREVLAAEGPAALRRYFHFKPLWQRALVVLAGPVANFVLAVVLFAALAMSVGVATLKPRAGEISPNSPAARAGFQLGDLVLSANGRPIRSFTDLQQLVLLHAGDTLNFQVERQGRVVALTAVPARRSAQDGQGGPVGMGYLGFGPSRAKADFTFGRLGPAAAVRYGLHQTGGIVTTSLTYLERMAEGRESGKQLSGFVGLAHAAGDAAKDATSSAPDLAIGLAQLALTMLNFAAFISVAVGFANLLPIPVLDGGHLAFYAYEAVARRPLAASVQAAGYRVGFAVLVGLMLFVTWNDLQLFRVFHLIGGLFS